MLTKKYLFGILIILLIVYAVKAINLSNCELVNGKVNMIREVAYGRNNKEKLAIASFMYKDRSYDTRTDISPKLFNSYDMGDETEVYFPTGEPKKAEIYSFADYWFSIPTIAVIILFSLLWIGITRILNFNEFMVGKGQNPDG